MAKKKIVFVMNNFWLGGTEQLLLGLMAALSIDYQVAAVTVLGAGPLESEFKKIPVSIYHASPVFFVSKKFIVKLLWVIAAPVTFIRLVIFLRKVKPDVVVTSLYQADVLGIFAAWLVRIPKRILVQHDIQWLGFFRKYLKWLLALRLATHIVAVSAVVKNFLALPLRVPENKITIIYNGINVAKFEKAAKPLIKQDIVFGIVGRLEPVKGHKLFLQALKILQKENLAPKVIFAGDGTQKKDLEQYIQSNSLRNVEFVGPVTDVSGVLKLIDILVVPSAEEGFGLVLLEGLVSRKIIIASDIEACRELLAPGETGILFENKNTEQLAGAMRAFILEPTLAKSYHRNIEKWIHETGPKYDIKNLATKYQKLF